MTSQTIPERELKGLEDIKKSKKHIKKLMLLNEIKEDKDWVEFKKIEKFLIE